MNPFFRLTESQKIPNPIFLYTDYIILTLLHFSCRTGDHRDDHSFVTTRTPKEAIMVMMKLESLKIWLSAQSGGIKKTAVQRLVISRKIVLLNYKIFYSDC